MSYREKLQQRGQTYAHLLDNWVLGRDRGAEVDPVTQLYEQLVADGRHRIVPQDPPVKRNEAR